MTIERLRELEQAAMPGPWEVTDDLTIRSDHRWGPDEGGTVAGEPGGADDIDLIVAVRNALPALLDLWQAARYVISPERTEPGDGFADLRHAIDALDKLP